MSHVKAKLVLTVEMIGPDLCLSECRTEGQLTGRDHGQMYAAALLQIEETIRAAATQYLSAGQAGSAAAFIAAATTRPAQKFDESMQCSLREVAGPED